EVPLVQGEAAEPDRVLLRLVGAGDEAVERHRHVRDDGSHAVLTAGRPRTHRRRATACLGSRRVVVRFRSFMLTCPAASSAPGSAACPVMLRGARAMARDAVFWATSPCR